MPVKHLSRLQATDYRVSGWKSEYLDLKILLCWSPEFRIKLILHMNSVQNEKTPSPNVSKVQAELSTVAAEYTGPVHFEA